MQVDVKLSPGGDFFVAEVDGRRAGRLELVRRDGAIVYPHTTVEPEYEGNGVGSALVRTALDAARAEKAKVVPLLVRQGMDGPSPRLCRSCPGCLIDPWPQRSITRWFGAFALRVAAPERADTLVTVMTGWKHPRRPVTGTFGRMERSVKGLS